MRTPSANADPDMHELVVFRTADQDFCVDILSVREIRGWTRPASLPHAPSYVQGVINLRGSVLPIIDLAARLGLPSIAANDRNVIIVTTIGTQVAGLLIEAVTEILSIPASAIQKPCCCPLGTRICRWWINTVLISPTPSMLATSKLTSTITRIEPRRGFELSTGRTYIGHRGAGVA